MAADNEVGFECHGLAKVNSQGQVQIPKSARDVLGWADKTSLMVFANASERSVLLTIKPLDSQLLALARDAGAKSRRPAG